MLADSNQITVLILDFDTRKRSTTLVVDLADDVIHRNRIVEENRLQESNSVVPDRDRRRVDALLQALFDRTGASIMIGAFLRFALDGSGIAC